MRKLIFVAVLPLFSFSSFAADGKGKISNVYFSGAAFSAHPNVVQFKIENGFSRVGCNSTYAAVRAEDSHLVSAVLSAKVSGSEIEVYLNPNDIYFNVAGNEPNRCIATAISIP